MERKIKSLSWSKINTFLEYPKNFIKTYFEEEPFFETKEILFGKVMSAVLELNSFDFEEILEHLSKDRNGEKKTTGIMENRYFEKIFGKYNK